MKLQFRLSTLLLLLTIGLISLGAIVDHVRQVQRYESLRQETVESFLNQKLREELRRSQSAQSSQEFVDSCLTGHTLVDLLEKCRPLSKTTMATLVDVYILKPYKDCEEYRMGMGVPFALGNQGRDAIPFLLELLKDSDSNRRFLAVDVLEIMAYRKEPEGLISRGEILALAAPIQTAMDTEDSPQIRSHLESLLNYLKHVLPKE